MPEHRDWIESMPSGAAFQTVYAAVVELGPATSAQIEHRLGRKVSGKLKQLVDRGWLVREGEARRYFYRAVRTPRIVPAAERTRQLHTDGSSMLADVLACWGQTA